MPAINLRATRGGRNMAKVSTRQKMASVRRLLHYVLKYYPWQFAVVLLCIIISSGAGVIGSYIVGTVLIDDYISPSFVKGVSMTIQDFNGLSFAGAIGILAAVYVAGLAS